MQREVHLHEQRGEAASFVCGDGQMRRAIKLVFHKHEVSCPYCSTALIYNTLAETIQLAERTCLKCGKGFLIENNVAKRLPSEKKGPHKAQSQKVATRPIRK